MEVVFTRAAVADLIAIRSYIARFNPKAARRMADRIKSAAFSLGELPERGVRRPDGARELAAIPPYVIVYDVTPIQVVILRVWHAARDRG